MIRIPANLDNHCILYGKPNRPISVETNEGNKVLYLFSSDDLANEVRESLLTMGIDAEIFRPESDVAWLNLLTTMAEQDVGWVTLDPPIGGGPKLILIDSAIAHLKSRIG